jgi:hypothetical protein
MCHQLMVVYSTSTNAAIMSEKYLSALYSYTLNELGKYAWIGLYGRPAITCCHGTDGSRNRING